MANSPNDYAELVALIRSEFELAIKPLREDIHDLKKDAYSREVLDRMFELRDARIERLEVGWGTLLTRVAAVIGAISGLIYAWHLIH